jgi:hypothetical protein
MAARLPDHPVGGPRTYPQPAPTPGHSAVDLPPMPGLASDELHLAPEDSWFKGPAPSLGDFPHVASQGVPDGGMLRVAQPHSTGFHHAPSLDLADFTVKPGGATEATVQHNNASWPLGDVFASPGSIEGLHALEQNKAAGVTPTHINSDGVGSPILHDVTARDVNPTKGGIIVDANTNEILKRDPSLTTQQVKALLAQWKANKPE